MNARINNIGVSKTSYIGKQPESNYSYSIVKWDQSDEKEFCYVVATIEYDPKEECCSLQSIGPRLLKLSEKERKDFFVVYAFADQVICNYFKELTLEGTTVQ